MSFHSCVLITKVAVVVVIIWCNQCISPLMLWVRTLLRRVVLDTTLC